MRRHTKRAAWIAGVLLAGTLCACQQGGGGTMEGTSGSVTNAAGTPDSNGGATVGANGGQVPQGASGSGLQGTAGGGAGTAGTGTPTGNGTPSSSSRAP